jgi:DNA (cytosine-5)-methyltransferase 1
MTQTEATRNSVDQEVIDAKTPRRALRVNGVAKFQTPFAGSLVINHREAYRLIVAAEHWSVFQGVAKEELPAIVSHWLQSPKDSPILLDESYRDKWLGLLRRYCLLASRNAASGLPEEGSHPRPIHIDFSDLPFPPIEKPKFTFIDLFAGIGGFRIALQELGGKCVFSSEWDRHATETYNNNSGEVPFGDITKLSDRELVKNIDVLAGGFPCQPFSRAGVSARGSLGQDHGFECETQGQLFFDVIKIAKKHRPKIIFLENVGNLIKHDGGNTFSTIEREIDALGYNFRHSVYNAKTLVPQSRVRCLIVAIRKDLKLEDWKMPELSGEPLPLSSILENLPIENAYTLSEKMWTGHIRRSERNVARGTGFTAYTKDINKPSTTLVARYYKDGKECLIPQDNHPKKLPRMLTERECARLQGFPERFKNHKSKIYSYKQFGNSVPVPLIKFVAENFTRLL